MKRRAFIAALGSAAAWPLTANAQQNKVWRVGYLSPVFPPSKSAGDAAVFEAFRQRMRDFGYVDGKNLILLNPDTPKDTPIDYLHSLMNSFPCHVM
jgi:putative tryptophan/tyrosine transport system substrate-binding protein